MVEKARDIYNNNEVALMDEEDRVLFVVGKIDTITFQARQHTKTEENPYMIECNRFPNFKEEEYVWNCSCYYGTHNDTCKHIMACEMILQINTGAVKDE
jgi:hypothetical protein